jgi:hypothetical protein
LRYASTILSQGVQMMDYFAAHAHVPGVRKISARDKRVTVLLSTNQIRMTPERRQPVRGIFGGVGGASLVQAGGM